MSAAPAPEATGGSPERLRRAVERLRDVGGGWVTPLGVAPLPDGPVLLRQPPAAPYDWVVLRLGDDPRYQRRELAVPRAQRARLRTLERADVRFDELIIGHEIPKAAARSVATSGVDPKVVTEVLADRRAPEATTATLEHAVRAAALPVLLPLALLAAPLAAVGAAGADPVLLGALTRDGGRAPGTPAVLFLLARWQ